MSAWSLKALRMQALMQRAALTDGDALPVIGDGMQRADGATRVANRLLHEEHASRRGPALAPEPVLLCKAEAAVCQQLTSAAMLRSSLVVLAFLLSRFRVLSDGEQQ